MPDDISSMSGGYYDPWARTAWLLVTSRSLGANPAYADRAAFVDALRSVGVTADASRVSRWESGQHPVSFRALRGYEQVLGLPEGSLVAANRQLVRDSGPTDTLPERVSFQARNEKAPDVLISGLMDRATGTDPVKDVMNGGDWLKLVTELDHFELVLLPSRNWAAMCERLVRELARTTGVDQLRRLEALATLVTHPVAQRHVLMALGAWFTDPDVQVVTPMVRLLQQLSDPAASKLLLKFLDSDNRTLTAEAFQVSATKLARGHFEPASLALLEQQALRGLLVPGAKRGTDLFDLLTHLPDDSFQRVVGRLKDGPLRNRVLQVRETHDLGGRDASRKVSREVATLAQSATPSVYSSEPDQLLQRLVREALFHVSGNRRRLATYLLGLSPYAPAVADCLFELTGSERELGERAWEAIWVLGHGKRRADVSALVDAEHAWTRRRALISLARSPHPLTTEEQEKVRRAMRSDNKAVRRAALYATGLQAPQHLPTPLETQGHPDAPAVVWWRRLGPAVRDADARPAPEN
jgi:hypothetical protein